MTKEALATRVQIAYEQLAKCHGALCRTGSRAKDDDLIYSIQDVLTMLLDIQVRLGVLKREEDI